MSDIKLWTESRASTASALNTRTCVRSESGGSGGAVLNGGSRARTLVLWAWVVQGLDVLRFLSMSRVWRRRVSGQVRADTGLDIL